MNDNCPQHDLVVELETIVIKGKLQTRVSRLEWIVGIGFVLIMGAGTIGFLVGHLTRP